MDSSDEHGDLRLDDIVDQRAYEREREAFRANVIAIKKQRRIPVGVFQTLLFENRDTIRFQIQEMARVEKINTDQGILAELRVYNPLISRPGRLCATLFLELTAEEQLREWLPKLVGIEKRYEIHLGDAADPMIIRGEVDPGHDATLTREEVTASVHYLRWPFTPEQAVMLADGPARVVCTHPAYLEVAELSEVNRVSLANDLV